MSEKDAYSILMEKHGYPNSDRYRQILEYLITPEQAKIVVELPASPEEIASKVQMGIDTINKNLDDLFKKGAVFPRNFQTREGYKFARQVMQLHDATQSSIKTDLIKDRKLFDLWEDFCHAEWYPDMAKMMDQMDVPLTRVVPAYKAIKDIPGILPYEDVREFLKAAQLIAVCNCSCRQRTSSIAQGCERSELQNCLQFNRGAEYVISRGSGRQLSYEEALAIVDATEEQGLVHTWPNTSSLSFVTLCNCCRDCCVGWVPLDEHEIHVSKRWANSRYEARVDIDICSGCQNCVEKCQFDAIEMKKPDGSKKLKASIDSDKCFGCGVCVLGCDTGALSFVMVRPPEHIPKG